LRKGLRNGGVQASIYSFWVKNQLNRSWGRVDLMFLLAVREKRFSIFDMFASPLGWVLDFFVRHQYHSTRNQKSQVPNQNL